MKKTSFRASSIHMIIASSIIITITIFLGFVLNQLMRDKVKDIVYTRMIETSETAAAFIDGEAFKSIDEDTTKESENYKKIIHVLQTFKENNSFVYIYTVKKDNTGKYVFVIDQDQVDPADYGEEIVYTDALEYAYNGITSVDKEATTDEWGSYYSTFSPIYDDSGNIVGVVGIDFDSTWYEQQLSKHIVYFIILSAVSLVSGAGIAIVLMGKFIKRFRTLNKGLSTLSDDIDSLTKEINSKQNNEPKEVKTNKDAESEIEEINQKMLQMEKDLKKYIDYVHEQTFTDTMTGVSSKIAYYEYLKNLDEKMKEKEISYKVIVFDLNGLKNINDNYGHECGDTFITNCAHVIMSLFGKERTFRIGGDEFIVILEDENLNIDVLDQKIFDQIQLFNAKLKAGDIPASFSFGATEYEKGSNEPFKKVFKRADEIMYQYKALYYKNFGDRRKN